MMACKARYSVLAAPGRHCCITLLASREFFAAARTNHAVKLIEK